MGSVRRECLDHVIILSADLCATCCTTTSVTTRDREPTSRSRRTHRRRGRLLHSLPDASSRFLRSAASTIATSVARRNPHELESRSMPGCGPTCVSAASWPNPTTLFRSIARLALGRMIGGGPVSPPRMKFSPRHDWGGRNLVSSLAAPSQSPAASNGRGLPRCVATSRPSVFALS
jgi:hypothetical protein